MDLGEWVQIVINNFNVRNINGSLEINSSEKAGHRIKRIGNLQDKKIFNTVRNMVNNC